ncbi:C-C motif chemokine 20 [Dissostichus eleginoides]|uniref:C-C motif chemokine n=1 Tax=Dissostichus eleginoides TaxID=100907 RepID=A0AAD9F0I7_DISEL|nr:C-C motif chemokine 20 [Dissostichus eleginoides]
MASGKVCFLATLCSLVILSTFIDSTQSASCCLRYTSRRLRCQRLLRYTVQTINTSCDINAIIFHLPGRFVCADPSSIRTQREKKCVDERRKKNSKIIANRT